MSGLIATEAPAAVLRERGGAFTVEHLEVEMPRAGEVVVAVGASGICHTDLIARDGWRNVEPPVVLGHEGAGTVVELGPGVTDVAVGDCVIMAFPFCGTCEECLSGRPYNCPFLENLYHRCEREDGSHPFRSGGVAVRGFFAGQSSFASHTVVASRNLVRLDPGSDVDLATVAPLGCGVMTGAGTVINALRPRAGSTIAIFGLGAVGLSAVMAARLCGCREIVAVDTLSQRLDLASDLGATVLIDTRQGSVAERAREAVGGGGVDYSVEAAGVPAAVLDAVEVLRGGGVCVFAGNHPEDAVLGLQLGSLEFNQALSGCVLGGAVPREFIPLLLQLHRAGRFPLERMIQQYPLSAIDRAVSDAEAGTVVKPVLLMP